MKYPIRECIEFIRANKRGYKEWDHLYLMSPEDKPFQIAGDRIYEIPSRRLASKR